MRGVGWLLTAAPSLPGVALGQEPASSAANKRRAEPQAASVVRGEIGRATFVELAPTASFVLIELTKLEDGTVPEDARIELGGELAAAAELGPVPEEPLPGKEKSGCSCEVARGAPAHALWLSALAFGFARRRRRLGACP